jgi:hypothetical protein
MDTFIDNAALVLPILGCDLFRRRLGPQVATQAGHEPAAAHASPVFTFATGGATATGQETEDGFVVFAGSTARRAVSGTFPAGYAALRDRLIASSQLVQGPNPELWTFSSDVTFSSPSAAASIVAGRSASGPLEWKIQPQSLSYRDWRASRMDETV